MLFSFIMESESGLARGKMGSKKTENLDLYSIKVQRNFVKMRGLLRIILKYHTKNDIKIN